MKQVYIRYITKTLIRLRECASWSVPMLFAPPPPPTPKRGFLATGPIYWQDKLHAHLRWAWISITFTVYTKGAIILKIRKISRDFFSRITLKYIFAMLRNSRLEHDSPTPVNGEWFRHFARVLWSQKHKTLAKIPEFRVSEKLADANLLDIQLRIKKVRQY